jgi:L-fuculose-phosphate aldolase
MTERELRAEICEIGRRLYARGFVAANEGNLSVRLGRDAVLCTPTLVSKGYMRPDELAIVDFDGVQSSGPRPRTSEVKLHLAVYRKRPDVNAVVHTHPPHVTAFAVSGTPVPTGFHPEMELMLGPVSTATYATPGTDEFAESVTPHLDRTSAVVLANHGVVTFGPTLEWAWFATEVLDSYCRLLLNAGPLGGARSLTEEQMKELLKCKRGWGFADPRF